MRHIILIPSTLSSPSSSQAKLRSHISQDGSSISPFLEALVMAEPAERFGLRTNLSLTNVSDLRATYSVSRARKWPTQVDSKKLAFRKVPEALPEGK